MPKDIEVVAGGESAEGQALDDLCGLHRQARRAEVDAAHAKVGPDTVAKLLFTSGSTG